MRTQSEHIARVLVATTAKVYCWVLPRPSALIHRASNEPFGRAATLGGMDPELKTLNQITRVTIAVLAINDSRVR